MNFYCGLCFKKSEYKFSKPKFCPNCGKSVSGIDSSKSVSVNPDSQIKSKNAQEVIEVADSSKDKKIRDLEKQLFLYKRISLAERAPQQDSDDSFNETDADMDQSFESDYRWQGSLESLRGTVKMEFDKSKKMGVKLGDALGSNNSAGGDFLPLHEKRGELSEKEKADILNELSSESSSQAKVIEID